MVNYTFDTSFLVKGLVCPRRVKKDSIYEQQMRIHQKAKGYLARVERQTELLTDDRQMYEKAKKHKIKTSFLREMS